MTIPLAFETVSSPSSTAFGTPPSHVSIAAAARVRARIRDELVGGDVLWRLTTKPWARARRGIARLPQHSLAHVVEATITVVSMVGMLLLSIACVAA